MFRGRNPISRALIAPLALPFLFAFLLTAFVASTPLAAHAASTTVVISQVYGGGGNSGATYKNDFIELYNLGSSAVDVSAWSVQYASSAGSSWNKTNLTGTIDPGHYYLIQEAAGAGGTLALPAPDAMGTIAMSATAAKVALANSQTALTGTCPTGASIVDFVGYGGANCSEGSPTAQLSNTTAAIRKGAGTTDTDNNLADFATGLPIPRSNKYPLGGVGLATPGSIWSGQTSLLTVAVAPDANPTSIGITVSCNLSSIGGAVDQALYDDGTHGDLVVGDNTFSFAIAPTLPGPLSFACSFADAQGRNGITTITLTVQALTPIGTVNGAVLDSDDGTTHRSPYAPPTGNGSGQTVVVQGVIFEKTLQAISTSPDSYKGFFIQNTPSTADSDPNTSDGLFVFMNVNSTMTGPSGPYTPTVGDEVVMSGTISEYYNMTELSSPTLLALVRSGVDLGAELRQVVANPPANLADANRYWERLQGMRVQVPQNSIVLGGRNVFSPADSEIWLARGDSTIAQREDRYARRAFRDAHPLDDNYDANSWDGNGYRILMGGLGLKATMGDKDALLPPARTFDTVTDSPIGGINYSYSKYRIEVATEPTLNDGVDPSGNNPPRAADRSVEYSIADYNLENLYDYRDNPFSGCDFPGDLGCPLVAPFLAAVNPPYDYVPASDAAYQARLTDIGNEIINDLNSPDVLMVQEVENQDICTVTGGALTCGATDNADGKPDMLQELALKVASLGGPTYDAAFDRDSSDLRGIAPAFLYRTDRVKLVSPVGDPILGGSPAIGGYAAVSYDSDVSNPKTLNAVLPSGITACETSWVFPRAPDIALFRIYREGIGKGASVDVYVVDNHFKSGPDTCVAHRTEQAKYNAALVAHIQGANPNARIVLGGDVNIYPRPDDPFAPIGQPASSDQLGVLYDPSLGLRNLWVVLLGQAPGAAYSYVYLGMAQTLDQMFVNQPMLADLQQFRIAHINSDFPADYPGDVARGTSDHDPNVAIFKLPNHAPIADAGGPYAVDEGGTVTLDGTQSHDPDSDTITYKWDLNNDGTFETEGATPTFSAANLGGPDTKTVVLQVTDSGGASATATATISINNLPPEITKVTNNGPVDEGSGVTITVTASDPGGSGDPLKYQFDCNNDGTYKIGPQASHSAKCTYGDNGTFTANVLVIDTGDLSVTGSTTITVNNAPPIVDTPSVAPEPSIEGNLAQASATFTDPGDNDAPFTCTVNYGDGSGDLAGTVSSTTCTGPKHTYATFGSYTVTVNVTDKDQGTGSKSQTHAVIFKFTGFFPPVDNQPTLNVMKAGAAVPVKFSLGGDKGLGIFAAGFPKSQVIACSKKDSKDDVEETITAGKSGLQYDPATQQYTYVWATVKAWAGTCRRLVIQFIDGTTHRADFQFK